MSNNPPNVGDIPISGGGNQPRNSLSRSKSLPMSLPPTDLPVRSSSKRPTVTSPTFDKQTPDKKRKSNEGGPTRQEIPQLLLQGPTSPDRPGVPAISSIDAVLNQNTYSLRVPAAFAPGVPTTGATVGSLGGSSTLDAPSTPIPGLAASTSVSMDTDMPLAPSIPEAQMSISRTRAQFKAETAMANLRRIFLPDRSATSKENKVILEEVANVSSSPNILPNGQDLRSKALLELEVYRQTRSVRERVRGTGDFLSSAHASSSDTSFVTRQHFPPAGGLSSSASAQNQYHQPQSDASTRLIDLFAPTLATTSATSNVEFDTGATPSNRSFLQSRNTLRSPVRHLSVVVPSRIPAPDPNSPLTPRTPYGSMRAIQGLAASKLGIQSSDDQDVAAPPADPTPPIVLNNPDTLAVVAASPARWKNLPAMPTPPMNYPLPVRFILDAYTLALDRMAITQGKAKKTKGDSSSTIAPTQIPACAFSYLKKTSQPGWETATAGEEYITRCDYCRGNGKDPKANALCAQRSGNQWFVRRHENSTGSPTDDSYYIGDGVNKYPPAPSGLGRR